MPRLRYHKRYLKTSVLLTRVKSPALRDTCLLQQRGNNAATFCLLNAAHENTGGYKTVLPAYNVSWVESCKLDWWFPVGSLETTITVMHSCWDLHSLSASVLNPVRKISRPPTINVHRPLGHRYLTSREPNHVPVWSHLHSWPWTLLACSLSLLPFQSLYSACCSCKSLQKPTRSVLPKWFSIGCSSCDSRESNLLQVLLTQF